MDATGSGVASGVSATAAFFLLDLTEGRDSCPVLSTDSMRRRLLVSEAGFGTVTSGGALALVAAGEAFLLLLLLLPDEALRLPKVDAALDVDA